MSDAVFKPSHFSRLLKGLAYWFYACVSVTIMIYKVVNRGWVSTRCSLDLVLSTNMQWD